MTAEQFAYWLQGFIEMTDGEQLPTVKQWNMIKDHLGYVFHNPPVVKVPGQVDSKALLDVLGPKWHPTTMIC